MHKKFIFLFFLFSFKVKDILAIHDATCPNVRMGGARIVQLSFDGVSESLSTSITLDVYSIKFKDCKNVYPLRIVRKLKKEAKIDNKKQLHLVLNDLYQNDCRLGELIADNPKRSNLKDVLNHASWFPCEYCSCKGTKIEKNCSEKRKEKARLDVQIELVDEKIDNLRQLSSQENAAELNKLRKLRKDLADLRNKIKSKKSNIVWPNTSMNGPPRTKQEFSDIVDIMENNLPLTYDEKKGITGRSILLDIPNFDIISDVPVEYMHVACLGAVKRCVELTFKVTISPRSRVTKRKLSLPSQFNALILLIKVPRESNRRVRELDFAVYKAQEYRNLLLFFFPLILDCIEVNAKERHMWLFLSYAIKACVIPSEEFAAISLDTIDHCMSSFYKIFEALFGVENCSYSIHMVGSHLREMRYHGPLTCTSAFVFESFYGELRNSFVPGTTSPLKQIMGNVLMKRALANHVCINDIFVSTSDTPLECNSMIYTYERKEYKIYKITSITENDFIRFEQGKTDCAFNETPGLNWSHVGVFKKTELHHEEKTIKQDAMKGKVLIVKDFLITCPSNVLREK